MNMKPKLLMVTPYSFVHAYSGVLYLADALFQRGVDIRLLSPIQREYAHLCPTRPYPIIDLSQLPFGNIPKFGGMVKVADIIREGVALGGDLLVNDYAYYQQAVWLKRLRPNVKMIHYVTEYLTPEDFPHARGIRAYERHSDLADLVVDVEPNRARMRQKRYGISKQICILPNTLPSNGVPRAGRSGLLSKLAGHELPTNRFVLLYAGTAHPNMSFDGLLEAIARCTQPIYLLGFIRGEAFRVKEWRRVMEDRLGQAGGCLCDAVPRQDLLCALHEADGGLIYYPPGDEPSFNQLYCAPTKLYEYLAAGLPVLGTANPSLRQLLETNGLGCCASEDSPDGLAKALEKLANYFGTRDREKRKTISDYFHTFLSFEKASPPVVEAIWKLLQKS
ncbi:MAG: glycosyltransferase [Spartobacteria bacterium]|nr:glycosyltransferase [Spartobacteria bacterium]